MHGPSGRGRKPEARRSLGKKNGKTLRKPREGEFQGKTEQRHTVEVNQNKNEAKILLSEGDLCG